MAKRTRVLLADDHRLLADALKGILEPKYEVVGAVGDGRSLLDVAEKLRPDVIVIDIAMPKLNGLDAARNLKQKMPAVKLVFMTMNEDPYLVGEAFRVGASAFLLKQAAAFELIDAIETVLKGGTYVSPHAAKGLSEIALREPKAREHTPEPTPRQREVIQLLAEGRTMKEVAGVLKITPRTVASHKYGVMELLRIKSNAELIQYAIKRGIISV
jgi:DNA-binding NarL/FixJ family response regulator